MRNDQPNRYHHARLLIGDREKCLAFVFDEIEHRVESRGNPDIHTFVYDQFGIAESRSLKVSAAQRPIERDLRTFILVPKKITPEAQNALLKLFEDPPDTAQFFLILPREDILIPTLLSRFYITRHDAGAPNTTVGKEFLSLSYAKRLSTISKKVKEKDSMWVRSLLNAVEYLLHGKGVQRNKDVLKEIAVIGASIDIRGSSPKMLLEHLALSVPQKMDDV